MSTNLNRLFLPALRAKMGDWNLLHNSDEYEGGRVSSQRCRRYPFKHITQGIVAENTHEKFQKDY